MQLDKNLPRAQQRPIAEVLGRKHGNTKICNKNTGLVDNIQVDVGFIDARQPRSEQSEGDGDDEADWPGRASPRKIRRPVAKVAVRSVA